MTAKINKSNRLTDLELLDRIAQAIYDKKGMNILALDVRSFSTLTDYVIIAEGNVDRHVIAIAQEVIDAMRDIKEKPVLVEGLQIGDWVVIDYLKIMVHLFVPAIREKYQLEQLWREGEIVDLKIAVAQSSN